MKNMIVRAMTKGYVVSVDKMRIFAKSERGDVSQNWIIGGVITAGLALTLYLIFKPQLDGLVQSMIVDRMKNIN